MGRRPCCVKEGLNRGPWSAQEDNTLINYIKAHGEGKWRDLPQNAGLKRCGKSCRLRWLNYLRPDIKRGNISDEEEELIVRLHKLLGNRWSLIAGRLPGRTDNEIKNYWNTKLRKRMNGAQKSSRGLKKKDKDTKKPSQDSSKQLALANTTTNATTATGGPSNRLFRTKATRCAKVIMLPHQPTDTNTNNSNEFLQFDQNHSDNERAPSSPMYQQDYNSLDLLLDLDLDDLLLLDLDDDILLWDHKTEKVKVSSHENVDVLAGDFHRRYNFPVVKTRRDDVLSDNNKSQSSCSSPPTPRDSIQTKECLDINNSISFPRLEEEWIF